MGIRRATKEPIARKGDALDGGRGGGYPTIFGKPSMPSHLWNCANGVTTQTKPDGKKRSTILSYRELPFRHLENSPPVETCTFNGYRMVPNSLENFVARP